MRERVFRLRTMQAERRVVRSNEASGMKGRSWLAGGRPLNQCVCVCVCVVFWSVASSSCLPFRWRSWFFAFLKVSLQVN